ncbi:DUF2493 domain-containing protein [Phenylobacterium sp. LjRoot225]|uniref:DUF2493 domain-containing protein n=1 Tax=Phenylobacterium sp. LjRoot225 TaxID=3342285 RepID=UPI003ED0CAAD
MFQPSFSPLPTAFDDGREQPPEAQLEQLGHALMTEVIDVLSDTQLEDFRTLICEALIGAFHSAAQRIDRDADNQRDDINRLVRDNDGSEIADVELQQAIAKTRAADMAVVAVEAIRDAAAQAYTSATGDVWTAWKGTVRASRATAAQMEARDALRAAKARKHAATDPGATIVAFRAAPQADTADDAQRIFDALNWAHQQWPEMALATTGAKGGEKIAIKWAQQKKVTLVLAKADFDKNGRAAPFRANDQLMDLEPVCVLTLANTLNTERGASLQPFGPALNLGQKAAEKGVRHFPVKARP